VICEYSLRSRGKNGRTLSPDYAFRIGKDPVFVEAKQPSKNLETDPPPAYQIRSYGWNANTESKATSLRNSSMRLLCSTSFTIFQPSDRSALMAFSHNTQLIRVIPVGYMKFEKSGVTMTKAKGTGTELFLWSLQGSLGLWT
jgi:hypothetical protein